jgi:hypothetical protein
MMLLGEFGVLYYVVMVVLLVALIVVWRVLKARGIG